MSITDRHSRLGVPTILLGMSYRSWTGTQIQTILDHYQWRYGTITRTKQNLMHELDLLVQEYDLDIQDRRDILDAVRRDEPPPERKPRVRGVPHLPLPDRKAVARRKSARNQAKTRTTSQPAVAATTPATLQAPGNTAFTDSTPNVPSALPKDCVVCFETLNPQTIPQRRITSSCSHEPDICTSCLAMSIATQLDSKVWDHIDCPSCGQRLDFQDVKAFADHEVFGRSEPSTV